MRFHGFSSKGTPFTIVFAVAASLALIDSLSSSNQFINFGIISVVMAVIGLAMKLSAEIADVKAELGSVKGEIRGDMGSLKANFYKALSDHAIESSKEHAIIDKRISRIEHALKIH